MSFLNAWEMNDVRIGIPPATILVADDEEGYRG